MTIVPQYSIPLYQPDLSGNEKRYVLECLESTWISSKGKFIGEFEQAFSGYLGIEHAVAVCNGTVALHLALLALDIRPGDEVIVPTLTYIAAVNAISYTGARPVFVDSRPDDWQMNSVDVSRKVSKRTKALMIVHLYGHPCEMDSLNEIAHEHDLSVIEDCAEAFGARYNGKLVGTFGDVATFSFFGNKTITTGEGGMVATNDEILSRRIRHLKGQGLAPNGEYWHDIIGYNYRMTNICAAIGLAQLERSDDFVSKKRKLADMYRDNLKHLPVEMQNESPKVTHSYWMNSILVQDGRDRDSLRAHLRTRGVETRPLFCPVHTMPMYNVANSDFPVAEDLASRGINLPSWPGLSETQVRTIATHIADYFKIEKAK